MLLLIKTLILYFLSRVNTSLIAACNEGNKCSEMGIRAIGMDGVPRAVGSYFVLTTDKEPYCRKFHLILTLFDHQKQFGLVMGKAQGLHRLLCQFFSIKIMSWTTVLSQLLLCLVTATVTLYFTV